MFVDVIAPPLAASAPGLPALAAGDTGAWVQGQMLQWRWVDKHAGTWQALVRFGRDNGLTYEMWLPHSRLRPDTSTPEREI